MSHRPKQAVIFDMDGLLIDSEPLWHQAEISVLQGIGVDTDHVNPEAVLGLRINEVVEMHYLHSPWQQLSIQDVVNRITEHVLEKIVTTRPLMPGVKETLQLAKNQGLKVGLASASPLYMIQQVVTLFDLQEYFDCLCSAENLPHSKPHPEVYLQAAESLQVQPVRCVSLEDSINGMIAAKAARMRSIVIPAPENYLDPRWALADLKLTSLLDIQLNDIL